MKTKLLLLCTLILIGTFPINANTSSSIIEDIQQPIRQDSFNFQHSETLIEQHSPDISDKLSPLQDVSTVNKGKLRLDASQPINEVINFGNTLIISGILQDGVGNKWTFANVELYLDKVHDGVWSQQVQTDGSGGYSFSIPYVYGDIGAHTYQVYFPNDEADPFRLPGVVKYGDIKVKDTVTPTTIAVPGAVGVGQSFTVSYTLKNGTGGDLDTNSLKGLKVDFITTSDSTDPVHSNPIATNTSISFSAGTASITLTAPIANLDYSLTVSITLSSGVIDDPDFTYVDLTTAADSIIVPVAAQLGYTHSVTIGGSALNTNTFYPRDGSTILISGNLNNYSNPISNSGILYNIAISGGGYTGTDITGSTNSNGDFSGSVNLTTGNFTNPSTDIVFTVTFPGSTNINPSSSVDTIKLSGVIGSITSNTNPAPDGSGQIQNIMYWPSGDNSIGITGTVKDVDGNNIDNLQVNIRVNNKTQPNQPDVGITTNYIDSVFTSSGSFSYTLIIPQVAATPWLTINITITATQKWSNPTSLTSEPSSFMYLRTANILRTVQQNRSGVMVGVVAGTNIFSYLNDTFDNEVTVDGEGYKINVTDNLARTLYGINIVATLSIINPSGTTVESLIIINTSVNGSNLGIVTFNYADFATLTNYLNSIIHKNYKFRVDITIGAGNNNLSSTQYVEEFIIYGPDEIAPAIQNVSTLGANTGQADNIIVFVKLNFAFSALDNIRNVTLYYRLSDNTGADVIGDAIFTASYSAVAMGYYPTLLNYNYTIPFAGHGIWVEYYVIVYDLAGYGLNFDGTTNYPLGYGWDTSISHTDNYRSTQNPDQLKMGDTSIYNINIETDIKINDIIVTSSQNITKDGNIKIAVLLENNEVNNYDKVILYYNTSVYDPFTGQWSSSISLSFVTMTLNGFDGAFLNYVYTFDTTGWEWFTELDYSVLINDTVGNTYQTPFISAYKKSTLTTAKTTWVYDEENPNVVQNTTIFDNIVKQLGDLNDDSVFNYNGDTKIYNFVNFTDTISFTYAISDTGSGIHTIYLVIWNVTYNLDGTSSYTVYQNTTYVQNGLQAIDNFGLNAIGDPVGSTVNIKFNIPSIFINSFNNVSWTLYSIDNANHLTIFNDVNNTNTMRLNFIAPEPKIIITTDTDGNTITLDPNGNTISIDSNGNTIILTPGSERNNVIWMILGFIGGLVLLIFYYQRHNITEIMARRRRANIAEGTLKDLQNEIERLKAEGKYRRAVELIWDGFEQAGREITETPRKYNQTASEYTTFLSDITPVELETLRIISDVYEKVRYSKLVPSVDELADAISAFEVTLKAMIQYGARSRYDEDDEF